jgi:hypothetical protein
MQSIAAQRWTGLGLLLGGTAATAWQWLDGRATGSAALQGAFAFPFFAVLGLALLVAPVSRRALLERHGVDRPQSLAHYSALQKALVVLALLAGSANLLRQSTLH